MSNNRQSQPNHFNYDPDFISSAPRREITYGSAEAAVYSPPRVSEALRQVHYDPFLEPEPLDRVDEKDMHPLMREQISAEKEIEDFILEQKIYLEKYEQEQAVKKRLEEEAIARNVAFQEIRRTADPDAYPLSPRSSAASYHARSPSSSSVSPADKFAQQRHAVSQGQDEQQQRLFQRKEELDRQAALLAQKIAEARQGGPSPRVHADDGTEPSPLKAAILQQMQQESAQSDFSAMQDLESKLYDDRRPSLSVNSVHSNASQVSHVSRVSGVSKVSSIMNIKDEPSYQPPVSAAARFAPMHPSALSPRAFLERERIDARPPSARSSEPPSNLISPSSIGPGWSAAPSPMSAVSSSSPPPPARVNVVSPLLSPRSNASVAASGVLSPRSAAAVASAPITPGSQAHAVRPENKDQNANAAGAAGDGGWLRQMRLAALKGVAAPLGSSGGGGSPSSPFLLPLMGPSSRVFRSPAAPAAPASPHRNRPAPGSNKSLSHFSGSNKSLSRSSAQSGYEDPEDALLAQLEDDPDEKQHELGSVDDDDGNNDEVVDEKHETVDDVPKLRAFVGAVDSIAGQRVQETYEDANLLPELESRLMRSQVGDDYALAMQLQEAEAMAVRLKAAQ